MSCFLIGRNCLCTSATALLMLCACPAFSQRAASPPSGAGASPPPAAGGTRAPTNLPSTNNYPTNNSGSSLPNYNRPVFLSGRVQFDDGSQANPDIRIERVCNGNTRLETHTDSKGRFYFQVGQESALDTDASDSSDGRFFGGGNGNGNPSNNSRGMSSGQTGTNNLWGCDLRAAYPGYRSDSVSLSMRQSMDQPELGTIVLHRLANVKGSTLSLTTAMAPKHAQKDYEKGLQAAQKGKLEDAEKLLSQATDVYPKYAIAWFALGQVEQRQKKNAEARKDYQAAVAADPKYVSSYDQLALLSAQDGNWQETADYSKQALELNPVEFPSCYWYNALASFNLKRIKDAEKDTRELLKLDGNHRFPQAESLLAEVLAQRGDYAEAATHLKAYLVLVPNGKDAEQVKQELAKLEQATASAHK